MIKFYLTIILEVMLFPFLVLIEEFKKKINLFPVTKIVKRDTANCNKLVICIHDWAGYDLKRLKKFKNNKEIECGLEYQINRLKSYKGKKELKYLITISDADKFDSRKYDNLPIQMVSNLGFDFSGYSYFIESLPKINTYVILMNSSVERSDEPFIDEYIQFMEDNPQVGLLGISYSTKIYQSLIRNNFTPHIQSFFLLSTVSVFKQIAAYNGSFPGKNISYKRLLIKEGEIKISKIVEKLGYSLAIIDENGKPYIFPKSKNVFKTHYKLWSMPKGDYRYHTQVPNKINTITNS